MLLNGITRKNMCLSSKELKFFMNTQKLLLRIFGVSSIIEYIFISSPHLGMRGILAWK